jgi:hypothetical protein
MRTISASILAFAIATSGGADARQAPVALEAPRANDAPSGASTAVQLASYFTFMRSFGRICYSDRVGWYYC